MKKLTALVLAAAATAGASTLLAQSAPARSPRVVSRPAPSESAGPEAVHPQAVTGTASYSVQLNIVTRVQGSSFFRTSVDITNNTDSDGVVAKLQYCYNYNSSFIGCTCPTGSAPGPGCPSPPPALAPLHRQENFHTDDIVQYLGATPGVLVPGADTASFGTLLVTFSNLPSGQGWEGTVLARTYSPLDQSNPALGTVASAYPASLFFESASHTLVGTVRDTIAAPTDAGALRSNIGITNTALVNTNPVIVTLQFFDATQGSATNGALVASYALPHALAAGEVFQLNNIWAALGIKSNVQTCVVFADVQSATGNERIEGYIAILDNGTRDNAFFEMKCSAGCGLP